jgi:O-antigen/teichoic acid export membrane protein
MTGPSSAPAVASLSTARKAAATIGVRFTVVIVLGVSSVLTARGLNPAGRGTYGLVIALSWIAAAVGHLSIEQANVLRWQRGEDRRAIASTSVLLGLLGGTVAALAGWLLVEYAGAGSFSGHDRRIIALVLPAVPLNILGGYLVGLHVLADRLRRVNVVRFVTALSQLVFLAVLWLTGRLDVTSAVAVWVVTLAAGPVILLLPGLGIRAGFVTRRLAASLLRTGLTYHLGMAALFLLRRVDTVMLNAQVSRRDVGLYVVAVLLAELVFLPGESIAQVVLPRQVTGSLVEAAAYTARIVRVNAVVGLIAALGLAALSPLVIVLAYGSSYVGSIAPLLALLPGVVAIGLTRPITAILVRFNRPFVVSAICIAALVINVALNLVLIPALGVVGAAIASSLAYAVQALAYTHWLLRSTPLRLSELRPGRHDLELFPALIRRAPIETP